jgi:hypothetical protein
VEPERKTLRLTKGDTIEGLVGKVVGQGPRMRSRKARRKTANSPARCLSASPSRKDFSLEGKGNLKKRWGEGLYVKNTVRCDNRQKCLLLGIFVFQNSDFLFGMGVVLRNHSQNIGELFSRKDEKKK